MAVIIVHDCGKEKMVLRWVYGLAAWDGLASFGKKKEKK